MNKSAFARPGKAPLRGSLRFRLTAWYTGVLAIILIVASMLVLFGARRTLLDQTDSFLLHEAHRIAANTISQKDNPPDPEDILDALTYRKRSPAADRIVAPRSIYGSHDGDLLLFNTVYSRVIVTDLPSFVVSSTSLSDKPDLGASLTGTFHESASSGGRFAFMDTETGSQYRAYAVPITVGVHQALVEVAVPWDYDAIDLRRLAMVFLFGVPLVLIVSFLGGWVLVGRTLGSIDRIVAEVERLDAAALPDTLVTSPRETDGEVARLVTTLNGMMRRIKGAIAVKQQFMEVQQRFVADASHELRTPLSILRAEIDLSLSRPRDGDSYRATLLSASEEAARLTRIVEGLTFLVGRDAGQVGLMSGSEKVDLGQICDSVREYFGALADEKAIALKYIPNAGPPVYVEGNADLLYELVYNLVHNALKYTTAGGRIVVALNSAESMLPEQADMAVITVEDTGIGISQEDLPHVFDRFWRADRSRSSEGTGLGLAIAREIAVAHNGELTAESEIDKGSRFIVTLPQ